MTKINIKVDNKKTTYGEALVAEIQKAMRVGAHGLVGFKKTKDIPSHR